MQCVLCGVEMPEGRDVVTESEIALRSEQRICRCSLNDEASLVARRVLSPGEMTNSIEPTLQHFTDGFEQPSQVIQTQTSAPSVRKCC